MNASFLNMGDVDFLYKLKVFAGMLSKRAFTGPYLVVIGGKYQCNYRCIFCEWFSPMIKETKNEILGSDCFMNMGVFRRLVRDLSILGTKIVVIGDIEEPFLDFQLIEKIKYAKKYNLGCFIMTNGSLINEENAGNIVDLKLDYLNVSINAGTNETYPRMHVTETQETFERIISMVSYIEQFKKKKWTNFPRTRLSMVVCNRNYHDIVKFVGLCHETGVKHALIKRLISPSKEIAEELELTHMQEKEVKKYLVQALKSAKKYNINVEMEWADWIDYPNTQVRKEEMPCFYGWLFSVIDANGNVRPCCFQDRSPSCTIGNIRKDNFSTLWFSKKYQDFRRKYSNSDERRRMGYLCNQPSCFFNNQQIYKILHKPYLLPITQATQKVKGKSTGNLKLETVLASKN
jgi:radical SAM protein with 4Fe4S-binding SPASM domain